MKFLNQLEFSTLLFDTIYGLILFYSFDSLVNITKVVALIFYIFSMFILVHWWLIFKSSDDSFDEEVTDSAADIVFGIIYAIILYYLVQSSRAADIRTATAFLVGVFTLDLIWASIWRYVGRWRTNDQAKIRRMEQELERSIVLDAAFLAGYIALFIFRNSLSEWLFFTVYIVFYCLFIAMTFAFKTLKIDIF